MKVNLKVLMSLCTILFVSQVYSCQLDIDCEAGSKCLKNSGSIYDVCLKSN